MSRVRSSCHWACRRTGVCGPRRASSLASAIAERNATPRCPQGNALCQPSRSGSARTRTRTASGSHPLTRRPPAAAERADGRGRSGSQHEGGGRARVRGCGAALCAECEGRADAGSSRRGGRGGASRQKRAQPPSERSLGSGAQALLEEARQLVRSEIQASIGLAGPLARTRCVFAPSSRGPRGSQAVSSVAIAELQRTSGGWPFTHGVCGAHVSRRSDEHEAPH
jgi:hypothetical protein